MLQGLQVEWEGKQHTLPSRRIMEALGAIEDCITLGKLAQCASGSSDLPIVRLSRAYHSVLRIAGVDVDEITVYRSMFRKGDGITRSLEVLHLLMKIMIPPEAIQERVASMEGNGAAPLPPKGETGENVDGSTKPSALQ